MAHEIGNIPIENQFNADEIWYPWNIHKIPEIATESIQNADELWYLWHVHKIGGVSIEFSEPIQYPQIIRII